MKILLITDDFLPYSTKISARMMYDLAVSMQGDGNKVTVLAPHVQIDEPMLIKEVDGVETIFFRSGKLKNIGKIQRAINETLLPIKAWQAAKKYFLNNRYDVIVYYSPSIFFGSLVRKLKHIWQAKSYLVLRDIFPQWTIDNGMIKPNSLIHKYFQYFEKVNYQAADKIGVMSVANLQLFQNKTDFHKYEVLYNWIAINPPTPASNTFRKKLGLDGRIIFFYGGNIGQAQHMINLIEIAKHFKNSENVHFLFVGQGDEVDLLLQKKEEFHLNNITYLPAISQNEYNELVKEIDVGLFSLHPEHTTHNFPGKLMGYMEASKPILGVVNAGNDLQELICSTRSGFVSVCINDDLLENAEKLIASSALRQELGDNGRKALEKYFSADSAQKQIIDSVTQ